MKIRVYIQMLTSTNTERTSPVGIPHSTASFITRKKNTTWFETDLDTLVTRDRGCDPPDHNRIRQRDPYTINRYANRETTCQEKPNIPHLHRSVDYHQRSRSPKLYSDNQYRTLMPEDALPELTLSQTNLNEDLERREYETYKVSSERLRQRDIIRTPMMDRDSLDNKPDGEEQKSSPLNVDINEADDRMKRYYGI
ncbi:hypothetical protein Anas_00276 [Armadillidium nasatum]|uniref:Uncharacterized protein n=1 Tax=Armadillidium nasatum TaxID=96803 RepID=A0A5N5TKF0_9CRUS|nr:hypothetical protein Anas_00276 [Armadillidium nasatum]